MDIHNVIAFLEKKEQNKSKKKKICDENEKCSKSSVQRKIQNRSKANTDLLKS